MSHNTTQVPENQNGGRKVKDLLCRRLLYWQGFEYEDPEPNLEFYLQFVSPQFARFLMKHRFLRVTVRFLRQLYSWILFITTCIHCLVIYPMGIYSFWENKIDVVSNFFTLVIFCICVTGMAATLFQKIKWSNVFVEMNNMAKPERLDNEEQKKMLLRATVLCDRLTICLNFVLVPFLILILIVLHVTYLIPQKALYTRLWYPFNTRTSPLYEITLILNTLHVVCAFLTANGLISSTAAHFILLKTNFDILLNKIENIRSIAIRRIQEKKVKESQRRSESYIVKIEENWINLREVNSVIEPQGEESRIQQGGDNDARNDNGNFLGQGYETLIVSSKGQGFGDDQLMVSQSGKIWGDSKFDQSMIGLSGEVGGATSVDCSMIGQAREMRGAPSVDCFVIGQARVMGGATRVDLSTVGLASETESKLIDGESLTASTDLYTEDNNSSSLETLQIETLTMFTLPTTNSLRNQHTVLPNLDVENISRNLGTQEGITENEIDSEMLVLLKEFVNLQRKLIRLSKNIGNYLNVHFIFLFVANTVTLAATAHLVTSADVIGLKEITFVVYCTELMQLYLMHNFMANQITDQSTAVGEGIYFTDWTRTSPSFKKTMLVIMTRANAPLEFKPTGLDPLSLQNFANVSVLAYKMIFTLKSLIK